MSKKKSEKAKAEKAAKRKALREAVPGSAVAEQAGQADLVANRAALRLAQMANLHMAGMSLSDIGAAIGATAEEVDQMLNRDASRYVRSQKQLVQWTRRWLSGKYTELLETNWDLATMEVPLEPEVDEDGQPVKKVPVEIKFAAQDRALRTLDSLRKLHGADAPVQTEVKIEAAPEAIDAIVHSLAAREGLAYTDPTAFEVIDVEQVHEAAEQAAAAELEITRQIDEEADA